MRTSYIPSDIPPVPVITIPDHNTVFQLQTSRKYHRLFITVSNSAPIHLLKNNIGMDTVLCTCKISHNISRWLNVPYWRHMNCIPAGKIHMRSQKKLTRLSYGEFWSCQMRNSHPGIIPFSGQKHPRTCIKLNPGKIFLINGRVISWLRMILIIRNIIFRTEFLIYNSIGI